MAARGPWRERVVVANLSERPSELEAVPLTRPLMLLRDAGFEVHTVSRAATAERGELEGLITWCETSLGAVVRRTLRLRPELLWVESITYGVVLEPLARRSWIRNPLPATDRRMLQLQQALVPRFDAVSVTNPAARTRWRHRPERFVDLPYPVDVSWWGGGSGRDEGWWTQRGHPAPSGPVLVCISAYVAGKGVVELVEMLAPWLVEHPGSTLVLVGHQFVDAAVTERLHAAPASLGVGGQVLVTGWMSAEEIRALLAWADVSIVNTKAETQCLAIYESLAAGVPTLITDIPELTSQFPTLLAHHDGEQLRRNLDRLLSEPELRKTSLETTRARLEWADVSRHDAVVAQGIERLLGRALWR